MRKNGAKYQQLRVRNPFPSVVLGDCGNDILKFELDKKYSFAQAKRWGKIILNRHKMGGLRIYESSCKTHKIWNTETNLAEKVVYEYRTKNYHIIFDRKMKGIAELHSILAWLCLQTKDW